MSAVITAAVRHAFKDNRGKRLAIALGCAVITGKRIASTGRVGTLYRRQLLETLYDELGKTELEIRQLRRGIDVELAAPKAAPDPQESVGTLVEMGDRSN